jgi:hypothetical protein
MVKDGSIPLQFRGEKDMWQSVKLMIGMRTNIKVPETIFNGKRNDVAFQSGNTLKTTRNMEGLVINVILVPFSWLGEWMDAPLPRSVY